MDAYWAILTAATACALAFTAITVLRTPRENVVVATVDSAAPVVPDTDWAGSLRESSSERRAPSAEPLTCLDEWSKRQHRCEQSVYRSARAVDTVSSASARQAMQTILRRMDAELPHVRALAQLGRDLELSNGGRQATSRANQQLDDAVTRFATLSERVLNTVVLHVADPDLGRLHDHVRVLRDEFPLLRPLSSVVGRGPCEQGEHDRMADLPA